MEEIGVSFAPEASDIGQLIDENRQALAQLLELVSGLSADQYQCCLGVQRQHTVGKHVRHILDHYQALMKALESGASLNYENRQRDRALETDPKRACTNMRAIYRFLGQLDSEGYSSDLSLDHVTDERRLDLTTSLGRELVFLASHTVHHMAIIGLLAEQLGISPAKDFGVHPSTLRHWQKQQPASPEPAQCVH